MAKGKKLSYTQREIMKRNGIKDCSDWLYVKQETTNEDGTKNLSLKSNKISLMVVRNVVTGEEKKIPM